MKVTIEANSTLTSEDQGKLINVIATTAPRTVYLPPAASAEDITIKVRLGAGPYSTTIQAASGQAINGVSTYALRIPGQVVELYCDGYTWAVTSECGFIEAGVNANGHYRKCADGTLECWNDALGTLTTEQANGNIWRSATDITWSFPLPFVSTPVVTASADNHSARWAIVNVPSVTEVSVRQFGVLSNATAIGTRARAVGRWV